LKVVVVYDISSDKLRNKFAKELFRYGLRVQYSVFEAEVTKKEFKKLEDLAYKYSNEDDKVSIYEFLDIQRFGSVELLNSSDLIF